MNANDPTLKEYSAFRIYSPLIFSLFYFMGVFADEKPLLAVIFLIFIFAVQCALYHVMATAEKKYVVLAIFMSITISFSTAGFNLSSYAFYWFCIYFVAFYFSRWIAISFFAAIMGLALLSAKIHHYHFIWFYLPVILPSLALLGYGIFDKQAQIHDRAQRKSQEQLAQLAKVAERERIARDLHDVMGHSLSTIALKAQLAEKLGNAGNTDAAIKEIAQVARITSETLNDMRAVITGYKAQSLEAHVRKLQNSLEELNFTVDNKLQLPNMTAQQETSLTLVLTEAITNIMKHSKGDKVLLHSEANTIKPGYWSIRVQDNGNLEHYNEGNGLTGIRERLAEIGAQLAVVTSGGMQLTMLIPKRDAQ